MTNNLKAERTLTADELQAIIDGCGGVTRGPWGADQQIYDREVGGEHEQSVGELIVYTENPETDDDPTHICEVLGFVPREDRPSWAMYSDHVPSDVARANAAHISRLDPETVTAMALELKSFRALAEKGRKSDDPEITPELLIWAKANFSRPTTDKSFYELMAILESRRRSQSLSTQQPMGEVRVKALEWVEVTSPREDGPPEPIGEYVAETPFGSYYIDMYFGTDSYGWSANFEASDIDGSDSDSSEKAKAAAQADYERGIRSALHPNQESGE